MWVNIKTDTIKAKLKYVSKRKYFIFSYIVAIKRLIQINWCKYVIMFEKDEFRVLDLLKETQSRT